MAAESDGQGGREKATIDTISPGMLEKLKKVGSPKINGRNYKLFNKKYTNEDLNKYTPEWSPSNFRPFVARDDKDYDKAGQTRIVDVSKSGKIK